MGENTKIEWTHHTFNPWRGCTKVSAGCDHCYAESISHRNPAVLGEWGDGGTRSIAAADYWDLPFRWEKAAIAAGERRRVFSLSLGDVFEDNPQLVEPRERLFATIQSTPGLDYLLLTKRPQNAVRLASEALGWDVGAHGMPPNVWLGTSVENQATAERIPHLLKVPAAVRFLSVEPLLGPVDLGTLRCGHLFDAEGAPYYDVLRGASWWGGTGEHGCNGPAISWVIVGGESGPKARPMHPDWARSIRDQCQAAGVPFFFKQWGEWVPSDVAPEPVPVPTTILKGTACETTVMARPSRSIRCIDPGGKDEVFNRDGTFTGRSPNGTWMTRVGKKAAGRLLDGREWSEFPTMEVA